MTDPLTGVQPGQPAECSKFFLAGPPRSLPSAVLLSDAHGPFRLPGQTVELVDGADDVAVVVEVHADDVRQRSAEALPTAQALEEGRERIALRS